VKSFKNETKFHPKFNEKSIPKTCSNKELQNIKFIKQVIQKWSQNLSKITPKIDAKKETKKEDLKPCRARSAEEAVSPNPIISKDILRSEVRRKYTKKVK
jgi:hypothetical protein